MEQPEAVRTPSSDEIPAAAPVSAEELDSEIGVLRRRVQELQHQVQELQHRLKAKCKPGKKERAAAKEAAAMMRQSGSTEPAAAAESEAEEVEVEVQQRLGALEAELEQTSENMSSQSQAAERRLSIASLSTTTSESSLQQQVNLAQLEEAATKAMTEPAPQKQEMEARLPRVEFHCKIFTENPGGIRWVSRQRISLLLDEKQTLGDLKAAILENVGGFSDVEVAFYCTGFQHLRWFEDTEWTLESLGLRNGSKYTIDGDVSETTISGSHPYSDHVLRSNGRSWDYRFDCW